jgi:actinorhodin biosynthesis protein ActVIA
MTVELVGSAAHAPHSRTFAELYAQAQQFYARQMPILDTHDTERWAAAFTTDALLELPFLTGPLPARDALARYVRAGAAARRRAGERLTHWVGLLDVHPRPDGTLHTRCSALVHAAPAAAGRRTLDVCVMEDVLVCEPDGVWRAAHRRVIRDDLA